MIHSQEESSLAPQEVSENTRRQLLLGLTTLAGALGVTETASAQATTDPYVRLLLRITYGPKATELTEAKSLGFAAYVEHQLNMTAADDAACETEVAARYPRTVLDSVALAPLPDDWITVVQLQDATMYRMFASKRQLYTKMCEFWRDHLNVFAWKVGGWLLVDDQNDVIRKHALGKFPDMLSASAHSACMMQYLDNAYSYGDNPNQNYARELMELHTMSVTGGYTQNDVINVSRALTGWSFNFYWDGGSKVGKWVYRPTWHDTGAKTVLGTNFPAGRQATDGNSVLSILSRHPSTARFISRKMIHFLLGDGTWTALENQVTQTYLSTGGDIKAMLRLILTESNILASGLRLKRPAHLFVSGLRMMNANVRNLENLRWSYQNPSGQEMFGWPPPNGYPDADAYWAGFLLPRWNFFFTLLSGYFGNDLSFNLNTNFGGATATAVVDKINSRLFLSKLPQSVKTSLAAFIGGSPTDYDRLRAAVALALCSPSFQYC